MSKPVHISEILPDVMADIKNRCNDYRREHGLLLLGENPKSDNDHRARVFQATKDFLSGGRDRQERHRSLQRRTVKSI
ncbi:hypothetical protein ACFL5Z_10010 [Planctomycetota bacterium]